jgi:hypothetical protein
MWNQRNQGFGAITKGDTGARRRDRDFDEKMKEGNKSSRHPGIDPDEREEYEEWRRERGNRGRKRKDKADGWHRYREEDDYWTGS